MTAEIISFGTELLLGQIVDTDAAYLAQKLSQCGVSVYNRATVGDNLERATAALTLALSRSDIVFCIGGLGPTGDDLTRMVIAAALDAPLVRDPVLVALLTAWFEKRGYTTSDAIFLQADVPTGGVPIPNANGTAPGLWVEKDGKTVVALPGPPNEFVPMVDTEILPRIGGSSGSVIRSRTLRIVGMGESVAEEKTADLMAAANPSVAPYAKPAEVHLRVTAKAASAEEAEALIAPVANEIKTRLGSVIYGEDDQTLEEVVVRLLEAQGKTVATAESCTGGWLAQRITAISGSSSVFHTGVVTYANESKMGLLGIPRALIGALGAVSPEVAKAMAERVRDLGQADFGIGVTGIAGPGGGSDEKPVGLVYIAVAGPEGTELTKNIFPGQRADVRWRATQTALDMLRKQLIG
ncbi:competence/damage-inducible protein A [Armatimonas sp.]|uniref:competence/damage-inducible protein A n=1 Tax=Armatimonas sp. TaxID=1872638 RepID=UPI00286A29E1|nr:competence/damage-inducible protein A [Armatimonas sp.]